MIRPAVPDEAALLTGIAVAAKRHWGYPESWIQQWLPQLTMTPEYVAANPTWVALIAGSPAGFAALQWEGRDARLEHLWVLPAAMGRGVGRALFAVAEAQARADGAVRLQIEGDPHAEGFYLRMGARVCGHRPAPVDGVTRSLPLLEKAL